MVVFTVPLISFQEDDSVGKIRCAFIAKEPWENNKVEENIPKIRANFFMGKMEFKVIELYY
jgi:hypothetical protein